VNLTNFCLFIHSPTAPLITKASAATRSIPRARIDAYYHPVFIPVSLLIIELNSSIIVSAAKFTGFEVDSVIDTLESWHC